MNSSEYEDRGLLGRVCVSRISMKPCKLKVKTAGSQGSLDKRSLNEGA